jgi:hypothetical protein
VSVTINGGIIAILIGPICLLQEPKLLGCTLAHKLILGYLGHLYGLGCDDQVQFVDGDGVLADKDGNLPDISLIGEALEFQRGHLLLLFEHGLSQRGLPIHHLVHLIDLALVLGEDCSHGLPPFRGVVLHQGVVCLFCQRFRKELIP